LAAFLSAVHHLFGPEASQQAAGYWMELLEEMEWFSSSTAPDWRSFTIAAASRLASSMNIDPSVLLERSLSESLEQSKDKDSLSGCIAVLSKVSDSKATPFQPPLRYLSSARTSTLSKWPEDEWDFDCRFDEDGVLDILEMSRLLEETRAELRRTQSELIECKRMALTGSMAYSISHDLRHHLSAVYCNVEFMSDPNALQEDREELLEEVHTAIDGMTDLLDSLLLFARTGQESHLQTRSLNQVIRDAVTMIRAHPDARDVKFVIKDAPLITGRMNCKQIGSAVFNLLLNACQAEKDGLAPRTVGIALSQDHSSVRIRVEDNGPGVPECIRTTLFQPFVTAERANGIGLGLMIAERAAREHGGSIDLEESRPGRTVFVLHLSKLVLESLAAEEYRAEGLRQPVLSEPVPICISTLPRRLGSSQLH
jgi:C4-dicarboxylate-specific signal transduction histidine kinase